MKITHLGHSAVLVETDGARVLLDPGNLTNAWHGLTDLDAILVTHQHPDHLDPEHVPALIKANPQARVMVEPSIIGLIEDGKLPSLGPADPIHTGEQTAIGDVLVDAVGGHHAIIHHDIPGSAMWGTSCAARASQPSSTQATLSTWRPVASTCWPCRRTGRGRR